MKTAILGGTFNPVHFGHIELGREVLRHGYEKIIYIPSYISPHKISSSAGSLCNASAQDRLEMLRIALEPYDWAEIWDGEIKRGGVSYTIDTVRELKKLGIINRRPALVIGLDLAKDFYQWKNAAELAEEVNILIAGRSSFKEDSFPFSYKKLNNQLWNYSSTEIRQMLRSGKDIRKYVPEGVYTYIMKKGLYDCKK